MLLDHADYTGRPPGTMSQIMQIHARSGIDLLCLADLDHQAGTDDLSDDLSDDLCTLPIVDACYREDTSDRPSTSTSSLKPFTAA